MAGGATDWASVDVGVSYTCARKTSGRLYCWGLDGSGQLGNLADGDQSAPVQVAGAATDWASVSTGDTHTCARKTSGRLYCWGLDNAGQVGNGGTNTDQGTPAEVAGAATDWSTVSAGAFHTCARKTSGRLFCWGFDDAGQLGDGGTPTDRGAPVQVAGAATDWASVNAGGSSCARNTTGDLHCWGDDTHGQLGDGGANLNQPTPAHVSG